MTHNLMGQKKLQKKSSNLSGQKKITQTPDKKNNATSRDKKQTMHALGTKKSCKLSGQKNHATSRDKKNHATIQDKQIM